MRLTKKQAKNRKRYYTIYKITNLQNGLCYIGQHRVWWGHENDGYAGSGLKLKKAYELYGVRNFKKTILHRVSTLREANALERLEIKKHDSTNPLKGYNIADGGGVKFKQSQRRHNVKRN